jgi:hypothetical protein
MEADALWKSLRDFNERLENPPKTPGFPQLPQDPPLDLAREIKERDNYPDTGGEKLERRAEEVRENEAALLGHLEKWTEIFNAWGEDLSGLGKQLNDLEKKFEKLSGEWEQRLSVLEKQWKDFVKARRLAGLPTKR